MFNNKNKIFTPENCLHFETKLLKWFGVYPVHVEKNIENPMSYFFKFLITYGVSLLFFLSLWLNVYYNFDDSAVVIETLYFGLTQTTFICKLINIQVKGKEFKGLVRFLSLPIFNGYTAEQYRYILDAVRKSQIFSIWYRGAVTITIIFFGIFPFLGGNTYLPLPSYFPAFIVKNNLICFLCQMIGIIMNGYCHSSMDVVVTTLISIGSAQFEILKDNLTNFRKGLNDDLETRDENDKVCGKRLKISVIHHVTTIEYAYSIESVFSMVQFIQFLISSIIICVTGFQIIVTPINDLKFVTLTLYFLCNLIQVTMCCWFGHDILTTVVDGAAIAYTRHLLDPGGTPRTSSDCVQEMAIVHLLGADRTYRHNFRVCPRDGAAIAYTRHLLDPGGIPRNKFRLCPRDGHCPSVGLSEGVGEACYMSDWYNCGSSVCRTLFIIMERSKRPVALTAGKFFDLSLQTLMQVLKTSYSYLALLRRMNEVREL